MKTKMEKVGRFFRMEIPETKITREVDRKIFLRNMENITRECEFIYL